MPIEPTDETFHRPDGTLRTRLFSSQGAGLYISGTATLINSNVYENEASGSVCSLFEPSVTFHPLPLWTLTSLSRLAQGGGVLVDGVANFEGCNIHDNTAGYVCLQLSLNLHPSPLWMELDLALSARRVVASLLVSTEWQTLKAATSMTTALGLCACILNLP